MSCIKLQGGECYKCFVSHETMKLVCDKFYKIHPYHIDKKKKKNAFNL